MKKSEESPWDTMKRNNIHIVGISEEKETESMLKAKKYIFFKKLYVKQKKKKKFPKLGRKLHIQIQEVQTIPNRVL